MWFICHRLLLLLGQELTKIMSDIKKIMAQEIDIVPRNMSHIIKQDFEVGTMKRKTGRLTLPLKQIRKNQEASWRCSVDKSSLQMKQFLLWRILSVS